MPIRKALDKILGGRRSEPGPSVVDQAISNAQSFRETDESSTLGFYCEAIAGLAEGVAPEARRFAYLTESLSKTPDQVRSDVETWRHYQNTLAAVGDDFDARMEEAIRQEQVTQDRFHGAQAAVEKARREMVEANWARSGLQGQRTELARVRRDNAFLPPAQDDE